MKVTDIKPQAHNADRVNVFVDGKYRFSLDVFQLGLLGVKVGLEVDEDGLKSLEKESEFSKVYCRARDYCLMRPHSEQEVRQYLKRKTLPKRDSEGELRPGISPEVIPRVIERLLEKGYLDDEKFANWWIENRHLTSGISRLKLRSELRAKGVDSSIVEGIFAETGRDEFDELKKVIAKKASKYDDEAKLMKYLASQGFRYDDIKKALDSDDVSK